MDLKITNEIEFSPKSEYPGYAEKYMKLTKKDGSLLKQLKDSIKKVKQFIASIPDEKLNYRYSNKKWSIKEVLVHIIDDERIYAYRALSFARNDKTDFPGFEKEDYAKYSNANNRSIRDIVEEFETVRAATITLFKKISEEAL